MAHDIEELEADIQRSRFEVSEAERFLVNHHKARIAEIEEATGWGKVWTGFKEVSLHFLAFFGFVSLMTLSGHWLVSGLALTAVEQEQNELEPPPRPAPEPRYDS